MIRMAIWRPCRWPWDDLHTKQCLIARKALSWYSRSDLRRLEKYWQGRPAWQEAISCTFWWMSRVDRRMNSQISWDGKRNDCAKSFCCQCKAEDIIGSPRHCPGVSVISTWSAARGRELVVRILHHPDRFTWTAEWECFHPILTLQNHFISGS